MSIAAPVPLKSTQRHAPNHSYHEAGKTTNPWETCLEYAAAYVDEETTVWKDEVEKLLIFAGLFSSVVASFAVEAYHNVKTDPADTTVLLLKGLLALQLNTTNPQAPAVAIDLNPTAPISFVAKRVIVYMSLSLILSVSAAMAGILCLQWLREYARSPSGIPGSRREHLGIRFMRREGLERWHVLTILTMLPLLLLLSLLLFFIGFIELLWEVDTTAGIAALVVAGIVSMFFLVTTLLPGFFPCTKRSQCPYKSPQAWIFYQLVKTLSYFPAYVRSRWGRTALEDGSEIQSTRAFEFWSWPDYDWNVYKRLKGVANVGWGLHWLGGTYLQYNEFSEALYQCVQDEGIHGLLRSIIKLPITTSQRPHALAENQERERERARVYVHDITVFQTLEHMVGAIEQGQPSGILIRQRLELFLKVNGEVAPGQEVDCPRIGCDAFRDLIPRETLKRVLEYVIGMLNRRDFQCNLNETHLNAVQDILMLESQRNDPDIQAYEKAGRALQDWISWAKGTSKGTSKATGRATTVRRQIRLLRNFIDPK